LISEHFEDPAIVTCKL